MGMSVGGGGSLKCDMNMTPFIDILLVLLIIFMVIAPITPKGLEALVPQPAPPGAPQNQAADLRTVVVSVNRDSSLLINADPVNEQELGPRLEKIFATRAERVVFVKGDPELEYQVVARVIDIAKGAGIDKVGLMTEKMESGQ
ncbi:MAG TPA: biopolymer transporter ExbD [Bryobacteraceae bacterium]|nr:biopolymer transporter ExbD [Bryobacteraceae bacterium]